MDLAKAEYAKFTAAAANNTALSKDQLQRQAVKNANAENNKNDTNDSHERETLTQDDKGSDKHQKSIDDDVVEKSEELDTQR